MTIEKVKLKDLAENVIRELEVGFANAATAEFHAAANPTTILGLLGEIEQLGRNRDMWKGQCERQSESLRLAHEQERQLRAEGEELRGTQEFRNSLFCRIEQERDALRQQVETLQAHPNSWQSGFVTGRNSMAGHADSWRKEAQATTEKNNLLRAELEARTRQAERAVDDATTKGTYGSAYYRVAEALGIVGARMQSPAEVFEAEIFPALLGAIKCATRYWELRMGLTAADGSMITIELAPTKGEPRMLSMDEADKEIDAAMKVEQPTNEA